MRAMLLALRQAVSVLKLRGDSGRTINLSKPPTIA